MLRRCEGCEVTYDDALASTLCPHAALKSAEAEVRWAAATAILGHRVRLRGRPEAPVCKCSWMNHDGIVGFDGVSGEFNPLQYEVVP